MKKTQAKITPYDDKTFGTMIPGPFVRYMRTNLLWQFFRFISINLKMLRIIRKSH